MNTSIEDILSQLVIRTAEHFNLSADEGIAAVVQSRIANEISAGKNIDCDFADLCESLYNEIAQGV